MADRITCVDLSVLTAQQRDVVCMHYESGLSFGAIAAVLGSTYSAVEQCHRRAIRTLRRTQAVGSADNRVKAL